jgi:hypothetical protein
VCARHAAVYKNIVGFVMIINYWLQEKKYKECYDDLSHVLRECVTHARMQNTIFCHTCICIVCL